MTKPRHKKYTNKNNMTKNGKANTTNLQGATQNSQKKIFIMWSGDLSKKIAKELKKALEKEIFANTALQCFFSDENIVSGEDWWNRLKGELKNCDMGIICITKENVRAPWIFFESGALVARDLRIKPLLFNCNLNSLYRTPIRNNQMVDFKDKEKFTSMIHSINDELKLRAEDEAFEALIDKGYESLKNNLSESLSILEKTTVFDEDYVYPNDVTTVNLKTLYISASMSELSDEEYLELRDFVRRLVPILKDKCDFTSIYSPLLQIDNKDDFDGNVKAIGDNFPKMKQAESLLVIYPKYEPSSVLIEIGYGLALTKNTVVFYKGDLPYMLKGSAQSIEHIGTWQYNDYEDIEKIIRKNGRQLFMMGRKGKQ